jgi:hypothetical protein
MQGDIRELSRGWQPSEVRLCVWQIEVPYSTERHMEKSGFVFGKLKCLTARKGIWRKLGQ